MAKQSISDMVWSMALPIVEEAGCELVDVEFLKEGSDWFLRVIIDKDEGVSHEDCERVSQPLNKILDERDPISHPFYLEVSSPGLERRLKRPRDYERSLGKLVEIRLFKAIDGVRRYEGHLESFDGKDVSIRLDSDELKIFSLDQIAKAKTIVKFDIGGI